ncbi:hypothetical protein IE53DRAFT_362009 [Violaceomyces palustris]|uniref:Uncharacterized protein n=1 Tax=Violaceomyces palustris TaxID=1673888 RepID=A0ACD0NYI5_9BASI|nr:hypothetical protein IE53DRAFT_362009 [Violaceomyces palustris]
MPRSPSAAYAFAGNRTSQISSSDPPQGGPSSSASTTPAPSNPSPRLEQRNSNNPYLSSGGRKDVSRDEYQSSRERVLLSPEMNVSQSRFRGDDVENDGLLAGASPDFNSPILNDRSAAAVAAATSPAVYRSGSARGRYSSEANDSVASLGLGLSTHNLHESESGQFNDASPSSQFYQQHHMRMTGSSSHASSLNESHQAIGGGGAGAMDGFIPTLSVTSSYASFSPSGVGAMNPLGKIGAGTDSQPGSGTSTPREKRLKDL